MLVDPSNSGAGARVAGATRQASQFTRASFNYLLATPQVESGLDPRALWWVPARVAANDEPAPNKKPAELELHLFANPEAGS